MPTVVAAVACITLMVLGTVMQNHTLQNWGIVAAAVGCVSAAAWMATKLTQAIREAALLRQDMERERILTSLPRQKQRDGS